MKIHFRSYATWTVALLVVVTSLPITKDALIGSNSRESMAAIQKAAKDDSVARRERRHRYYDATELYWERTKRGEEDIPVPNVNDPKTIDFYFEEKHEAAPVPVRVKPSTLQLTINAVSDQDRLLLRRYERAGTCPESLKQYVEGFYELCVSLADKRLHGAARTGFINDLVRSRTQNKVLPKTLNNRLEMLRQAKEGTKRTDGTGPSRTTDTDIVE